MKGGSLVDRGCRTAYCLRDRDHDAFPSTSAGGFELFERYVWQRKSSRSFLRRGRVRVRRVEGMQMERDWLDREI